MFFAVNIGGGCYQLTEGTLNNSGAIWYSNPIDLSVSFNIEFTANFGITDDGADGIVFVLQNNSTNELGGIAQGIGYEGMLSSLGVEIDTWNNTNLFDMVEDHVAIVSNGDVNHSSPNNLVGPVTVLPSGANIEDGQDYLIQIQWDSTSQSMEVFINCVLTIALINYNIVDELFMGNPIVWYGFTSATGGFFNVQTVCPSNDFTPCCNGTPAFIRP